MIAAHFENLLFLLLVAVAVLFQLLAKTAGRTSKDQTKRPSTPIPRTPPPIPRRSGESDEERIRKLLEALGQPPTSRPPSPAVPRADIPPRPLAPVRPPTAHLPPPWKLTREERRKRKVIAKESPAPPTVTREEEIVPPKIAAAPAFEVQEAQLPVQPPPIIKTPAAAYSPTAPSVAKGKDLKTDISTLLASASGLRDAMILREIFGPPRSLQPLKELSGPA
jgi:hypothetical protein